MTILEVLRMTGRGASAQFRFDNRKPGSTTPLLFELADKHLKNCERMYVSSPLSYNLREYLYLISYILYLTIFILINYYVCQPHFRLSFVYHKFPNF